MATGVFSPAGEATSFAQAPATAAAAPRRTRDRSRATRLDNLKRNGMLHSFHRWFSGNKKGRRELEEFLGFAGGPAGVATYVALVPWLCAAVFRRLCSEQRDQFFVGGSANGFSPR